MEIFLDYSVVPVVIHQWQLPTLPISNMYSSTHPPHQSNPAPELNTIQDCHVNL